MKKISTVFSNLAFICKMVYKTKKNYYILTLITILINALDPVINVYVIKGIVNAALNKVNIEKVMVYLLLLMIYVMAANCYMSWYQHKYSLIFRECLNENLSEKLYVTAGSVKISEYDDPEFYNSFTKAIKEVDNRCMEMLQIYIDLIQNVFGLIGIIYLIVSTDVMAIFIISAITIVSLIFSMLMSKPKFEREQQLIKGQRKKEYINRIFYLNNYSKEIRLFDLVGYMSKKHEAATEKNCEVIEDYGKKLVVLSNLNINISSLVEPILILYFLNLIIIGKLDTGSFVAALTASQQYQSMLMGILVFLPRARECNLHLDKVLKYFSISDYKKNSNKLVDVKKFENLQMKNIFFSYDNGMKNILKDFSVNVDRGDKILITGDNGSGKSTLINLILKFYEPDKGLILYNDEDYSNFDYKNFWSKFSVCFQKENVYNATVLENILMKSNISESEEKIAIQALRECKLLDRVNDMKFGIYTVLSKEFNEDGEVLSGGEEQKLFLARMYVRTILKNADIIVLDEAFSAISEEDSSQIIKNIYNEFSDKTIFMISHYHKEYSFFNKRIQL